MNLSGNSQPKESRPSPIPSTKILVRYLKQRIKLIKIFRIQSLGILPQAIVPHKSSYERPPPLKRAPYSLENDHSKVLTSSLHLNRRELIGSRDKSSSNVCPRVK